MAKKNAVVEAAEVHADRIIAAADHLAKHVQRMKEHAKTIRANTRTGELYTADQIQNFEDFQVTYIQSATARAVALAKGEG